MGGIGDQEDPMLPVTAPEIPFEMACPLSRMGELYTKEHFLILLRTPDNGKRWDRAKWREKHCSERGGKQASHFFVRGYQKF